MGRLANDVVARSTITISDGSHYEKQIDVKGRESEPVCIDDEIPFDIPDTWEWVRINDICITVDCPHSTPSYLDATTGFFAIDTNCMDDDWSQTGLRNLDKSDYEKRTAQLKPKPGDIVFSREGSIGRSVILQDQMVCLGQRVMLIRCPDEMFPEYCQIVLSSPFAWVLYNTANVGTGVKHINVSLIRDMIIPVPPKNEQSRIVNKTNIVLPYVVKYGDLEDAQELLDSKLPGRLRKSVLQVAVEGKLVPQDPSDEPASALLERIRTERRKLVAEGKVKALKGGESVIYRSSDGGYYEKCGKAESVCIDDEIPFEIPESWEWVRLRSIGVIVGGGTPKTGYPEYWSDEDDGIPWITPADMKFIKGEYIRNGTRYISEVGLSKSSAQLLPSGSVLMSSRAPIGYLGIAEVPLATNQGFKSVVLTNVDINRWVLKSLEAIMPSIEKRASGTTFKEISGNEFSVTLVPLPPLSEQYRIVAMIDRIMPKLTNQ